MMDREPLQAERRENPNQPSKNADGGRDERMRRNCRYEVGKNLKMRLLGHGVVPVGIQSKEKMREQTWLRTRKKDD